MKIVTIDQVSMIESRAGDQYGLNSATLMEHAGLSIAECIRAHFGADVAGTNVLVLVGPGNNGGDGRVAARHLSLWGASVAQYIWRDQRLEGTFAIGGATAGEQALAAALEHADVVLDALLGTGHGRPLDPTMRALLHAVENEHQRRPALFRVAVDLPSGLNADTGEVDAGTFRADLTITLAFPKLGLLLFPGADYVGDLEVGGIGLPPGMADGATITQLDGEFVRQLLPARPLDSNKGTFGKAMILAGSPPYPGSAFLACSAAGRSGAGLVTLATSPNMAPIYAVKLSEATFTILPAAADRPAGERARALLDALHGYSSLLMGPGLGQEETTGQLILDTLAGLRALPDRDRPRLVVDADALNMLARLERWWELVPPFSVLTPHPGEMSRLLGGAHVSGGQVDRVHIVREASARWQQVVVLKGACTLIAEPGGQLHVNWPPNPALATAGTGDVLAGIVAGLLAQDVEAFSAASTAVYCHARAGINVSQRLGNAGLLAGDLLGEIPIALHDIRGA